MTSAVDAGSLYEECLSKSPVEGKAKKRKIGDARAQEPNSGTSLKLIVDIPVDALLEIFKHLELVDLMHLSRTSSALRSILMSRNSISVWKQVVVNAGLPPCPKDLNEPQLAELIFGRDCDWCGSEGNFSTQEIIWVARARACKRCIETTFELDQGSSDRGYPVELVKLLPRVVLMKRTYFDGSVDREWRREYTAKPSKVKKLEWLHERVADRTVISEHAAACQKWFKSHLQARVRLRKAVIIERLWERGWKEELDKLGPKAGPTNVKEVVKACQSELTEPILAALDKALDIFMEKVKTTRLARKKRLFLEHMLMRLREISEEYSHTLSANHILPNTADIYFHPTVRAALSAVESHEQLEEVLARIQLSLREIVNDCLQLSKQHLANLVIDEYTKNIKSFDLSVLTLASTLFHCSVCSSDLTLDQTIAHGCRRYDVSLSGDLQDVNDAINEVTTAHKIGNMISFSLVRLEPFTSVLHSCGIDPDIITAADMNALDPIVECLGCSNMYQGQATLRWTSVANHFQLHSACLASNVSLLDEPEAEIVRARMLEQYQRDTARSRDHLCVHCKHTGGSMTLIQHAKRKHHIDLPVYGQDVIVSPGASTFCNVFYLWPPKV